MPYLLSKVTVLFGLAFVQAVVLLGMTTLYVKLPLSWPGGAFLLFATVFLCFCASILMGLFVSSLFNSPDEGGAVVPLMLLPQVIFAGSVIPLKEIGGVGRG